METATLVFYFSKNNYTNQLISFKLVQLIILFIRIHILGNELVLGLISLFLVLFYAQIRMFVGVSSKQN